MERYDSAVFERLVPPQDRYTEHEEARTSLGSRVAFRPVCVSVLLPADPVTSLYLSFQSRNLEILSHSSASRQELLELLLSGPVTGEERAPAAKQYYVIPSSVFPVLFKGAESLGGELRKKFQLVKIQNRIMLRPLFLKQTCLL